MLLDLDHFKAYNDHAGHQAGDAVLREVALLLEDGTRGEDRVYRYGGEEILLVLLGQDAQAAGPSPTATWPRCAVPRCRTRPTRPAAR